MTINKTVYTCGSVGSIEDVAGMLKRRDCKWLYFVYKTNNPRFLLQIGNYNALKRDKANAVILGVASSAEYARKIVEQIIMTAYLADNTIDNGIKGLIE